MKHRVLSMLFLLSLVAPVAAFGPSVDVDVAPEIPTIVKVDLTTNDAGATHAACRVSAYIFTSWGYAYGTVGASCASNSGWHSVSGTLWGPYATDSCGGSGNPSAYATCGIRHYHGFHYFEAYVCGGGHCAAYHRSMNL